MTIILILLIVIIALMVIPCIFGLFVLYHTLIRDKQAPCDKSNRINHLRLVWFAMSREDLFADTFPWLKQDEMDNLK